MDQKKMDPRPVSESRVSTYYAPLPADANTAGSMFGGNLMRLMDSAGYCSAVRHTRSGLVTAAASVFFRTPVKMGEILILHSSVNAVWNTSLEVGVRAESEHPITGERKHVCTTYLTFVAVDDQGKPIPVPPLLLETDDDHRRMTDATRRMIFSRLEQKHEHMDMGSVTLHLLPGEYAVCRMDRDAPMPDFSRFPASSFLTMTATDTERSLLLDDKAARHLAVERPGLEIVSQYRCLKIADTEGLHKIGMLAGLTSLLAASQIPVLVVSAYQTAFLLIQTPYLSRVLEDLNKAGHEIVELPYKD